MKALATDKNGALSIVELDVPEIGPYQALVKTVACGICSGTDAKLIHGDFKHFDTYPALLGHEGVGRVEKIGEKVKNFKIGDHVLLPYLEKDNRGYFPGWCGFAEYGVIGDYQAMPAGMDYLEGYHAQSIVPDSLDPVKAVMIVTYREVLSAVRRFGFKAGEPILIYGAGPVGLSFIRFSKLLGLSPIIAVEIDDDKLKEAEKQGADVLLNGTKCDVVAEVRQLFPDGIGNIVNAAGVNALLNQALNIVAHDGKICVYGICAQTKAELDWTLAPHNFSLLFAQWPSKVEEGKAHAQVLEWLAAGELDFDDFIAEIVPFENIIESFESVLGGAARKKIIIRY